MIETVEGLELRPDQADAVALLAVVTGQDVEPDPDQLDDGGSLGGSRRTGRYPQWIPSPARSQNPQPQTGRLQGSCRYRTRNRLVTEAELTAANTPDGDTAPALVAGEAAGTEIVADSAYASGPLLETFENRSHTTVIKPLPNNPRIKDG